MIVVEIKPAKNRCWLFPCKHWQLRIWSSDGTQRDPRETFKNSDDIKKILEAIRSGHVIAKVHYKNRLRMEINEPDGSRGR